LRRNPSTAFTKLITVTGYGTEDDRWRSREAGVEAHLAKPVSPESRKQALGTPRVS
jgi:CheY-like chemotaxis protein